MTAPTIAPPVFAPAGALNCGKKHPSTKGVRCGRAFGHDGGHLSRVPETYWPAETAAVES